MLTELLMMLATVPPDGAPKVVRTVREAVCELRAPTIGDDAIGLLSLPAAGRLNEMGVLLLINCSDRKIISLRDPSRSRRHLNAFPYDPRFVTRLRGDPGRYEVLNFNARAVNSVADHTTHSKSTYWTGPCRFAGLELTTAAADNDRDRQTTVFDLDICETQILALLEPATISGP